MRLKFLPFLAAAQLLLALSVNAQSGMKTSQIKSVSSGQIATPAGHEIPSAANQRPHALPLKLNVPPDSSLWFRYYQAGEDAMLKHDTELEKKYLLASLSELEKVKSTGPGDIMFLVKISALETYLEDLYPFDWTKAEGEDANVMKFRGEQVSTLYRIARINERFTDATDLLRTKSKEHYENVRRDYEKAVATAKQSKPGSTQSKDQ
jgi:hypothetical protein